MKVVNATCADPPGGIRTFTRSEKIGSSTAPTVPVSSAPSSSASAFLTERPRPTNFARSVSHVTFPTSSDPDATTCAHQIAASVAERGRRVASSALLYVAPLPVIAARAVMPPPRDGEISVTAEPAAGVGDESRVWNVAENADDRLRRVRRLDFAYRGLFHLARHSRHIVALN